MMRGEELRDIPHVVHDNITYKQKPVNISKRLISHSIVLLNYTVMYKTLYNEERNYSER